MSTQEEKLKAIADAIREKDGTTDSILANSFPERIRAISTVPDGLRTIAVTADPPEGGTVSGGGLAQDGMTVTVNAEKEDGYKFTGWMANGVEVGMGESYTFTVTGDVEVVAVFAVAARLPDGYTEVQYIESDSKCSINTGLAVNNTNKILLDITPNFFTSNSEYLWGQDGSGVANFVYRSTSTQIKYRFSTSVTTQTVSQDITGQRIQVILDGPSQMLTVGSSKYSVIVDSVYSAQIYLLGYKSGAGISAKLHSAIIYESNVPVRDFVPCIDPSGIVGLYDIVNGVFYKNAGTGSFTAGPAI